MKTFFDNNLNWIMPLALLTIGALCAIDLFFI